MGGISTSRARKVHERRLLYYSAKLIPNTSSMRYIFIIISTVIALSSCSFVDDKAVKDTSDIPVSTFLDTLSREGTGVIVPDIGSGMIVPESSTGNTLLTSTGKSQPSAPLPPKIPIRTGGTSTQKASGAVDTSTGAEDQEIEGLIDSLFDNL